MQKHHYSDFSSFYGLSADGIVDTIEHKIRGGPWLQRLIICNLHCHFQKKKSSSFKMFCEDEKTPDLALGEDFLCCLMGLLNEAFRNPELNLK